MLSQNSVFLSAHFNLTLALSLLLYSLLVHIFCSHKLLQISHQRPKFTLRSTLNFHPDIINVHTGVMAAGDGMVVASSGCERICKQYFSVGWSFLSPFWVEFDVIPTLSCQPKPSWGLQLDVHMYNTHNHGFMLRRGDKAFRLSIPFSYGWIKLDLWGISWFTTEPFHLAQAIRQSPFKVVKSLSIKKNRELRIF